jgi:hypothetical protein
MHAPFAIDPTNLYFAIAVLLLTGLIGAAILGSAQSWLTARQRRGGMSLSPAAHRHCLYCRWGHARLHEESVKFEDHDRVTVRCYVCNSCGLPQWFVHRAPVGDFAEY